MTFVQCLIKRRAVLDATIRVMDKPLPLVSPTSVQCVSKGDGHRLGMQTLMDVMTDDLP